MSRTADPGDPRLGEDAPTTLVGTVELVTFHAEDSLYTVLRLSLEDGYSAPDSGALFTSTRVTAVGRTPDPAEGMRVRLSGRWGNHKVHGQQFEFEDLEPLAPIDEEGLVRYLASKAFQGIGETLARRIVEALGTETLETIRDHPERLDAIRGLRPEVAERLVDSVRSQLGAHRTAAFLRSIGLGPLQARAVVSAFGPECEGLVRDDPYAIARVPSLGFLSADKIAAKLGLEPNDPRRLRAGVLHALAVASGEGHSLLPQSALLERVHALLQGTASVEVFAEALARLESDRELIVDRSFEPQESEEGALVYLPWLHVSECGVARAAAQLLAAGEVTPLADAAALAKAEHAAGIELHETQRNAVLELLSTPLGLLTGGPGVGKTTIVRIIVALAQNAGAKIALASPTGRAAKRLSEATGRDASTIHRLLQYNPGTGGFEHDASKPLEADVIVVDEISMLDVALAHHLLKAVRSPTRLIFVGDPDQLPSVGPGHVLADLIASGVIPVARLSHIFRQDSSSLIVTNAHRILDGELPRWPEKGDTQSDFYLFPADDPPSAAERLIDVVARRIPATFGFEWRTDVQVIAPMYRGECGVDALNERLRDEQGYGGREVVQGRRTWRLGDRVLHTRNDYEKEVFNGDMGRIVDVTDDGVVTVRYPEQDVGYSGAELSDLRPAFAITVHRSQGGEFPVVVVPLVTQHFMMLQRNLLYTAITRARKLVVLVGSRRALQMAVDNADQRHRESALRARLVRLAEEPDETSLWNS